MASHIKKYEIVTLAVHALFTAHRTSGISGLILCGVLCAVWYRYEEEDGGGGGGGWWWKFKSLNMHFFFAYFIQRRV